METYSINTLLRQSAFLAQVGHESGGLIYKEENLNYSAEALQSVFPKYFPNSKIASAYARQPKKIANRVYANRMGNGDEQSGEGWKYRGYGLIQITGKDGFLSFAKEFAMTLDEVIDYLRSDLGAAMSAGWFWNKKKLNELADKELFKQICKRVNGGLNGYKDRKELYARAKRELGKAKEFDKIYMVGN